MEIKRTVGFAVKAISNEFMRFVESHVNDTELTGMQHGILHFISENSGDTFQRDVEKEFNIRRSTATEILQLMEKNGFITKESVANDRRLKKLVITSKGKSIEKTIDNNIDEIEKISLKGISDADIETFFRVLDKISENIK